MDASVLRTKITEYITANNTCALATGADGFIRNTPIEYSYHDGCFWMFSEGGEKFVRLEKNPNVCIAIFDKYADEENDRIKKNAKCFGLTVIRN
mgnify:CR=1 FL=1